TGTGATVGVQQNSNDVTQYECNTGGLAQGMKLTFTLSPYSMPTVTVTSTVTSTVTFTKAGNRVYTPTSVPPSNTPTITTTPGPCVLSVMEGFESGTIGIFQSSGSPGWSAVTGNPYSGVYSGFAPDVAYVSDQQLIYNTQIAIPFNATQATLSFWQKYDF